jgi:hypothetical protein
VILGNNSTLAREVEGAQVRLKGGRFLPFALLPRRESNAVLNCYDHYDYDGSKLRFLKEAFRDSLQTNLESFKSLL